MDSKRRLLVLKMTMLAIEEAINGHSIPYLACQFGARFDVTKEEVAEILGASLQETANEIINNWMPEIPMYDPAVHGPLKDRPFAISRGDKWEAFTVGGQLVNLPEDHEMVQNWKNLSAAEKQLTSL